MGPYLSRTLGIDLERLCPVLGRVMSIMMGEGLQGMEVKEPLPLTRQEPLSDPY